MKKRINLLGKITGNEKGLTLIELLAVIVILAIISAIAIPAIGSVISGTKKKAHNANGITAINAARFKAINDSPTVEKVYKLKDLVTEGYLEKIPSDPDVKGSTYGDETSYVTVKLIGITGNYSYSATLAPSGTGALLYFKDKSEEHLTQGTEDAEPETP
ncbi:prepilin-type N-terminal cleavage/methylation domain-containing protein [Paenibacillus sp. S3N08]|uniref:Prepilin-type N-terminal cleavage/methylation domain-containing protein n=2 Tax=Paenibacillus agricola TaxID=2716264 RepID=A0ABX0J715_9BACL|nr:prepilin-type N-terminal cleavage/methylation domain-containing protein [Paenibacillus agricola]